MDKMLYIAMSGAKQNMQALSVTANNLANDKTTGFKADLANARSMQAFGEGLPTRVFSMTERAGQNFDSGALLTTGRDLDIAIQGQGWLTVQTEDGSEAYTRNGQLKLNDNGALETSSGDLVIGDNGPIFLPLPVNNINISADGTIMVQPEGAPSSVQEEVGREGSRLLKARGATIWAQDEESCVVYGMPQAVTVAGISTLSLALESFPSAILKEIQHG